MVTINKFKIIVPNWRSVGIVFIIAGFTISMISAQKAHAESKKVTGAIKATTVIGRQLIQCFTDGEPIPAGDLRNRVGAYSSDDQDWNNTTFFTVSFVGPKSNIVYGIDIHPNGDQTFRQLKGTTKMKKFGTIIVTNEGFFVGGTGKYKGIIGKWKVTTEATSTEQAGRKTTWEAEYELVK
ncbi:MAG: hypothetical protein PVJ84_03310 [Desulfobacteraceae bacterium]|jgi:hypothetical protein